MGATESDTPWEVGFTSNSLHSIILPRSYCYSSPINIVLHNTILDFAVSAALQEAGAPQGKLTSRGLDVSVKGGI